MTVSHRAKILVSNKLKKLGVRNPSELRDIEEWIEEEYDVPEYSIEVYYNGGVHPRLGNRYRLVFTENLDLEKFVKIVEEEENLTVENRRDNLVSVMEVDEYGDDTVVKSLKGTLRTDRMILEIDHSVDSIEPMGDTSKNQLELIGLYFNYS